MGWVRFAASSLAALVVSVTACAPALQVMRIDSAEEKPANVLLFFRVQAGAESVAGLEEGAFTVKEDAVVLAPGAERVLVNPDLRAQQVTFVLVDLSGHPSPAELDALSAAVSVLADRAGASKRLAVYALDGADQPAPLAPLGATPEQLKAAAAKLAQYKQRDPSLDLNGGYVQALRALIKALPANAGPKIGNLVLFTRGVDRASRMTAAQVDAEVKQAPIDLGRFTVAFGADAPTMKLEPFGQPWLIAPAPDALADAAARVGDAIDVRGRSYYLLSYCSGARAGEHKLTVDVSREHVSSGGHNEVQRGTLVHSFRADGFGPGCTPSVPDGWRPSDAPKTMNVSDAATSAAPH
jgi:hypothetical protein